MMKRNILAVVISALLATSAVNAAEVYNKDGNKLDLYGKVTARYRFSDNKSQDGDKPYARLGFKGENKINNDLIGYGRYEAEFIGNQTENSDATNTRYAFAGLKITNFGSIDYGRNMGITYDSLAYTDVLPEWGSDQSNSGNFLAGRSTSVLTYRNKDFFGLINGMNFGLQYQGKNSSDTLNKHVGIDTHGDGWGTSLEYNSPIGISIIGNYAAINRTKKQNTANTTGDISNQDKKAEAWGTGLKYDANNIYVAAIYSELRNVSYLEWIPNGSSPNAPLTSFSDKTEIFKAVAQYNFDFGLTPSLGYVQAKAKGGTARNISQYIKKYVTLGATYVFNKNFSLYSEYDINLIKSDNTLGVNDNNKFAVGVTYKF
ncbi:MAG: porin [Candidatus Malihini olakiniferum]